MKNPTRRARKVGTVIATPIAVVVAAALIWQSSYAAFTGTTRNSGNNWATGSVALTDDDAGSARFQASDLVPGQTETKCITLTANASVPGVVKGYTVNPVLSPTGLQDHIIITTAYGHGGGFGSCEGFVEEGTATDGMSITELATYNTYENGSGDWAVPAGKSTRTYQISWTFDPSGLTQSELNGLQGANTGIDMQWELQSN